MNLKKFIKKVILTRENVYTKKDIYNFVMYISNTQDWNLNRNLVRQTINEVLEESLLNYEVGNFKEKYYLSYKDIPLDIRIKLNDREIPKIKGKK